MLLYLWEVHFLGYSRTENVQIIECMHDCLIGPVFRTSFCVFFFFFHIFLFVFWKFFVCGKQEGRSYFCIPWKLNYSNLYGNITLFPLMFGCSVSLHQRKVTKFPINNDSINSMFLFQRVKAIKLKRQLQEQHAQLSIVLHYSQGSVLEDDIWSQMIGSSGLIRYEEKNFLSFVKKVWWLGTYDDWSSEGHFLAILEIKSHVITTPIKACTSTIRKWIYHSQNTTAHFISLHLQKMRLRLPGNLNPSDLFPFPALWYET